MSVVIHTKSGCPYCDKAKLFFEENKIPYQEEHYDTNNDDYQQKRDLLLGKTHHKTFPQIFVGDTFIGGYTELMNAFSTLRLHDLLQDIGISLDLDF
jgi:glutaredoxin